MIQNILILILFFISGCSADYLNTKPSNAVSEELTGSSIENLYMAINGIHRKMVSQDMAVQYLGGYPGFMITMDVLSDDMTWEQNDQFKKPHQWQLQAMPGSNVTRTIWLSYYEFILNANLILENVEKFAVSDPKEYKIVKGEALCFRAFSHFMLLQTYARRYENGKINSQAGIPYRFTSATHEMARNTVEECYQYILADLDQAISLLEGYTPKSISHFSPIVALGLKARVALARQDYPTAAQNASAARILAEKSGFSLMTNEQFNNGFADISTKTKEALWAALTLNDQTVNYYSFYALVSWNFNSEPVRLGAKQINEALYHRMSASDLRRSWWDETGTLPLPAPSYQNYPYASRKFTARSSSDPVGNVAFMRLSELYLTEAEALARDNQENQARKILADFAVTRDPAYTLSTLSGPALIDEIMIHRRIELWGEGFRFYDLKRLNEPLNRNGANFNAAFCIVTRIPANDPRWQWAIPQDEMDANPLMEQNQY